MQLVTLTWSPATPDRIDYAHPEAADVPAYLASLRQYAETADAGRELSYTVYDRSVMPWALVQSYDAESGQVRPAPVTDTALKGVRVTEQGPHDFRTETQHMRTATTWEAYGPSYLTRADALASTTEPPVHEGYTASQLQAAFDLVKNRENWKNPIYAMVGPEADMRAVGAAVEYYTGSVAEVSDGPRGGYLVKAAGYYANIGA